MAKCTPSGKGGKGGASAAKPKRKGHPANMFILFYLETWRRCGGNMFCVAKECGKRWKSMSQSEKDKYKRMYCSKCKNCKSCRKPAAGGGSGGKGGRKC